MENLLHPFMDQTTMKTLLAFTAAALVLNLVSGNEVRSDLCTIEKEDSFNELHFPHPIPGFRSRGQTDEHLRDQEVLRVWPMPG